MVQSEPDSTATRRWVGGGQCVNLMKPSIERPRVLNCARSPVGRERERRSPFERRGPFAAKDKKDFSPLHLHFGRELALNPPPAPPRPRLSGTDTRPESHCCHANTRKYNHQAEDELPTRSPTANDTSDDRHGHVNDTIKPVRTNT